jgi:pimeloyl-ACP methyl ester carboxylesterase
VPTATNRGVSLYYETDGDADDDAAETVAFVADAGFGAWTWGWQQPAVAGPFETVVHDHRGTGRSDPGDDYSVRALTADLEAVLSAAGARSAHLVGVGLGAMVALRYARDYGRARTLTLVGATAGPDASVPDHVRDALTSGDDRRALEPVFTDDAVADPGFERVVEWRRRDDAPPAVHRQQLAAAETFDATDWLYEITQPALVVHGTRDEVRPVEDGERLAEGLPRGEFVELDGPHFVQAERSRDVNDELLGFLEEHTDDD